MKKLIFIIGLLASTAARADVTAIVYAVVEWVASAWTMAQVAFVVAVGAYQSSAARRAARRAAAEAREKYNASLEERTITLVGATPAWRIVYGRCIVGGDVVASFHTDKSGYDDSGKFYTKKDGYRHVVVRIADHEVEAIHGILWAGVPVGPLTGTGWAMAWTETRTAIVRGTSKMPYSVVSLVSARSAAGDVLASMSISADGRTINGPADVRVKVVYTATRADFVTSATALRTVRFVGSITLAEPVSSVVSAFEPYTGPPIHQGPSPEAQPVLVTVSPDGLTITSPSGGWTTVDYIVSGANAKIRASFHTGAAGQTVDTYLNSVLPQKWTAAHTLDGKAYAVITFDLEDQRFQGGPSELSFDVSGRKVYDPRTAQTAFSPNPALITNDFLTAPWGYQCEPDEVNEAYLIVAANACDTSTVFTETDTEFGTVTTVTGPLYTCHGTYTTDESKESTLEKLTQSMAGWAVDSSEWLIIAGVWTSPVRTLGDNDLNGSIEIIQGDNGIDETFNGVRGRYLPRNATSPTDFTPYSNSTLVTADGEPLWDNIEYTYTDSNARCTNLARIHTELSRTGLIIKYPAKLSAWRVQIGDRVTVTNKEFNITNKKFRVTDWQHTLTAPVELLLQEDEPESYDTVDTTLADPTKDISVVNPWIVKEVPNVQIASGTEHLLKGSDGTISVRVHVSWDELTDPYVSNGAGRIEVLYRQARFDNSAGTDIPEWVRAVPSIGGSRSVYLTNVNDRDGVIVQVRAINSIGIPGPVSTYMHEVVGKTQPPGDVTGVYVDSVDGRSVVKWNQCPDVDYSETVIQLGSWSPTGAVLFSAATTEYHFLASAGTYTLYLKHRDTSNNYSLNAEPIVVVITATGGQENFFLTLTPEILTLAADSRGSVSSFGGAVSVINVNSGVSDHTADWTYTKADTGVQSNLSGVNGNILTVTGFDPSKADANFPYVVLQPQFDYGFSDSSTHRNVPSIVGTLTSISVSNPKFGLGSLRLDGDYNHENRLVYGPNRAMRLLSDYNIKFWVRFDIYHTGNDTFQMHVCGNGYNNFYTRYSSTYGYIIAFSPYNEFYIESNTPFQLNQWHYVEVTHVAATKTMYMFQDGALVGQVNYATRGNTWHTSMDYWCFGHIYETNDYYGYRNTMKGNIDAFTLTVGKTGRTAAYTVPNYPPPEAASASPAYVDVIASKVGNPDLTGRVSLLTTLSAPNVVKIALSPASLTLAADYLGVVSSFTGANSTASITLDSADDSTNWTYWIDSSSGVTATLTSRVVAITGFTADTGYVTVTAVKSGFAPQAVRLNLSKAKAAKPAQTSRLNRTSIQLVADTNGYVPVYTSNTVQIIVYIAGVDDTSNWTITRASSAGVTTTISDSTVTLTAMADADDTGYIDITASKTGWTTVTERCLVSKSKVLVPVGVVKSMASLVATDSAAAGNTATAGVRFNPDGTIELNETGNWFYAGNWYNPTTANIGASYWVSLTPGGQWYNLDIARGHVISVGSIVGSVNFSSYSVRASFAANSGGTPVLGTCSVALSVSADQIQGA